ncbi:MAG: hypothetical protein Tsb0017_13160 [Geothermobacteraceae bacterium]
MSPPDRIETDLLVAFFQPALKAPDGPAGLIDLRLGGVLRRHLEEGGRQGTSLLVRGGARLAGKWAMLLAGLPEEGPDVLGEKALTAARKAGFRSLVIAPPVERDIEPGRWLEAFQVLAGNGEFADMECMVTFNRSYMHDHSAIIFNA